MRFVDASVFVHAYLKPKRELKPHEKKIKKVAKEIITRINDGEKVVTSAVHLSEIANILEDFLALEKAHNIESSILSAENIKVAEVSEGDYIATMPRAVERDLGINNALALFFMNQENIEEIYSFDKDFEKVESVKKVPS